MAVSAIKPVGDRLINCARLLHNLPTSATLIRPSSNVTQGHSGTDTTCIR